MLNIIPIRLLICVYLKGDTKVKNPGIYGVKRVIPAQVQTRVGRWKQAGLTRIARLVQSQDPAIHEQKHPGVNFRAQLHLSKYIRIYGYLRFPIISLGDVARWISPRTFTRLALCQL